MRIKYGRKKEEPSGMFSSGTPENPRTKIEPYIVELEGSSR